MPLSVPHHLAALLVATTALVAYVRRPAHPRRPAYYADWDGSGDALPVTEQRRSAIRDVFMERLKHYRERCDALRRNTYYWVLLIGLTVLILSKGGKESFEIFSIPIPAGATHAIVVTSMLYLWMEFGSTLKFLVYERMTLWKLVDRIEDRVERGGLVPLDSLRPMLHGVGFLDHWFVSFLPDYTLRWDGRRSERRVNATLNVSLWIAAAFMIGLAHASAFILLWDAANLWGVNPFSRAALAVAQFLVLAVIILCYMYFQVERHGEWFFLACAICCAVAIEALPYLTLFRS